jgi:long-subunit acyl-CoA synthetase (AMP-forming)
MEFPRFRDATDGLVVVPIHSTVSEEHLLHILTEADIQLCVASKRELFQKVDRIRQQAPALKHLFTIEQLPELSGLGRPRAGTYRKASRILSNHTCRYPRG